MDSSPTGSNSGADDEPELPEGDSLEVSLDDALKIAQSLHQLGRLGEAELVYRGILGRTPDHPDVRHFLGILCHQLGRSEEGIALLRSAIEQVPGHADMHSNLGNVMNDLGRLEEAEASYRKAIELNPAHGEAWNNLGAMLLGARRLEEAEAACRRALELRPEDGAAWHNLGSSLKKQGRLEEAVDAYRNAVRLRPGDVSVQLNLANSLYRAGLHEKAIAALKEWLVFDPGNPFARHHLAAIEGGPLPERAPDGYVTGLFNAYARKFDSSLKALEYRAPELVAEAVGRAAGEPAGRLEVLDAGCGTGLCAPLLRPFARSLVGVDLSAGMLAQARERGGYDDLVEAELTRFLSQGTDRWDLIISADTLCYFGDLSPVFEAAARALRPGGGLFFTVEHLPPEEMTESGVRLNPHGRYSHSQDYVRRAAAEAGLPVESIVEDRLRNERGKPVPGLVVALRRPASGS